MKRFSLLCMVLILIFVFSGCQKDNYFTYKSDDNDWSMKIPKTFQKESEETIAEIKLKMIVFKDNKGKTFSINEIIDPDMEISEESLKIEMEADTYLKPERTEIMDVEGFGKIYGVLFEDHATESNVWYYRVRLDDKVTSFAIYQKSKFTFEEETEIKSFLSTLKKL
ncbi:MAG: hypothetical protein ACOYVK_19995 [Bacillota bacterium]